MTMNDGRQYFPGTVLVTGGHGQLAHSLGRVGGDDIRVVGRPEFDFDRPETVDMVMEAHTPAIVINTAAWTAVDAAEQDVAGAMRANRDGPALLARGCARREIPFIHVSTDYVFNGQKGTPYRETDTVDPRCVYGLSKAEGEAAVLAAHDRSIILRTAWVYSAHGRNFVLTMLKAGETRPELRVVGDQFGNPTSADDLASGIMDIVARLRAGGWHAGYGGIFHAAGYGGASWYDLASVVMDEAHALGRPRPGIVPIATADWPTPAYRPADTRLDTQRLYEVFGVRLPDWRESVRTVVRQACETEAAG